MITEKPLTFLLGHTFNMVKLKLQQSFNDNNMGLNMEQFIILNLIDNNETITQQEIANHLQKDKSLILRIVDTFLEKSLVARKIDKDDKRKKILILTSKGHEKLKILRAISRTVSDELLTGISPSDQEIFVATIQRIQENTGQTCQSKNKCKN